MSKGETRFDGFDDRILSLYARGIRVREIQGHLENFYPRPVIAGALEYAEFQEAGGLQDILALAEHLPDLSQSGRQQTPVQLPHSYLSDYV